MDKELKGYITEIIIMVIILSFAIPICVNASNNYNTKQKAILSGLNTTIDITNKKGNIKQINLYSNTDELIKVKLGLMITNFYNEYTIEVDGNIYDLNELEYLSDEKNRYYIIGIYEIDKEENIEFELKVKGNIYYEESISYSFYTEGII